MVKRLRDGNPIRMAGLMFVVLLAGPGSCQGALLLAARSGTVINVPYVPGATHAVVQVLAFVIMIWGFLTHALQGILGCHDADLLPVRVPMTVLALCTLLMVALDAAMPGPGWRMAGHAAVLLASLWGTVTLLRAALRGEKPWYQPPLPVLIIALAMVPVGLSLWLAESALLLPPHVATEFLLSTTVLPIILVMGHRMFTAMLNLHQPRVMPFVVGMAAFWLGASARAVARVEGLPLLVPAVVTLLGSLLAVWSLRLHEGRRGLMRQIPHDTGLRLLNHHVNVGAVCFVLSQLAGVMEALSEEGGQAFIWGDLARHLAALGCVLVIAMGITSRVLPRMVRGRAAGNTWMSVNLVLLVTGLALRVGQLDLPRMAPLGAAAAAVTYAAVLSFGFQLARGLLLGIAVPRSPLPR